MGSKESSDDKSMDSSIVLDDDTEQDTNDSNTANVFQHLDCNSSGEDSIDYEWTDNESRINETHSPSNGAVPSQIYANEEEREDADCPFEMFLLNPSRYSSACTIYKIDDGKNVVAVPYPKLYCYRGAGLRQLSRYEYCTQVKIEKQKKR